MKQGSKENCVFELEKSNEEALSSMSYLILLSQSLLVGICSYLLLYYRRALKYLQQCCFLVRIRGFRLRTKNILLFRFSLKFKYINFCFKSEYNEIKYMSYALPSSSQSLLPCISVEPAKTNASRNKQGIMLSFSYICKYQRNNHEIKSPHKVGKCTLIM